MSHWIVGTSPSLFEPDVPPGFFYRDAFVTERDEQGLLDAIAQIEFSDFEMRGVVARRRVAFFGHSYDGRVSPPLPAFLLPLRAALGHWAAVAPEAFAMALINEYRPGAPIGWHRDAPQYDITAGVSILSSCRMTFRPYVPPAPPSPTSQRRSATHEALLARRSAYLITGSARTNYEHHIPPVAAPRYSITFRTLRHGFTRAKHP